MAAEGGREEESGGSSDVAEGFGWEMEAVLDLGVIRHPHGGAIPIEQRDPAK